MTLFFAMAGLVFWPARNELILQAAGRSGPILSVNCETTLGANARLGKDDIVLADQGIG